MQPVFASENVPGSVGHPRYLTGTQLGTVVESGPVAHVAWYDSIKYAERVQDSNTELSTIRNYYWSLYYGDYPLNIGPSVATYPGWWLVAFFNPGTEPFDGNVGRWEFWSEWAFSHPLEDAGLTPAASGPGVADHANQRSESAQVRFNPLGANVFRRVGTNGILQESITARPFYG
jgi:hypothetical protein